MITRVIRWIEYAERLGVCDSVRSRCHAQLWVQLADVGLTVFGEMWSVTPS
jgi:hypothetical protein